MSETNRATPGGFASLYARFRSPITALDCGQKCAPYNENGAPFCCDTRHAVPTAYQEEWVYLQENTELWHLWNGETSAETNRLEEETPECMHLIECLGHRLCQRDFRSITCRAFPFFPYFSSRGEFLGLSYYWDYEDRCWVISNLNQVSLSYRSEFIAAYEELFELKPEERNNFQGHSHYMRQLFIQKRRTVPLLHRNGEIYKISPRTELMRRITYDDLPKYGPYRIAAELPFPDEIPSR